MKNVVSTLLFLIQLLLIPSFTIHAKQAQEVYDNAIKSGNKVFATTWPYEFMDQDHLYGILADVNMLDKNDARYRFLRMLHASYLNSDQIKKITNRLDAFVTQAPKLVSFIEHELSKKFFHKITVQHLSVYGSYLYNETDPDDIDLLIIVDSPIKICTHLDFPATKVLGKNVNLPTLSFQIIDYNTYLYAKVQTKNPYAHLSRGEKLALQHLTVVANWYYTIYGFDLRFENTKFLKMHMQINYLNKAFNTLKAAGERLYKVPLSNLPNEKDSVRLRKVVSRLLITDHLLKVLHKSYASSSKKYTRLYAEIRTLKEGDYEKIGLMTAKIEDFYLKKLNRMLKLAEKYNKIDYLDSQSY